MYRVCKETWYVQGLQGDMVCIGSARRHGMYRVCKETWYVQGLQGDMVCTGSARRHGMYRVCKETWYVQGFIYWEAFCALVKFRMILKNGHGTSKTLYASHTISLPPIPQTIKCDLQELERVRKVV